MNRIFFLFLSLSFLLSCIGCAQKAQDDTYKNLTTDLQQPLKDDAVSDKTESVPPTAPEQEEPYVRVVDPSKPLVALTFDDGPHPTYSHAILDTLEAYHGVATFFEVAVNIPNAPDALVRMLELGCEVGSHSNIHQDLGKLNQADMLLDLQTADEAFMAATGKAPTLLRPPYGSVNDAVKMGSGRSVVTWDVDTLDWESKDAAMIVSYIQSLGDLDGNILLMHSIYESTAEATKTLVPWLMEQGYQLVTVSELFAYYYGELLQPNQFYGYTYFTTHGRTDTPVELPDPNEPVAPVEIPIIDVEPEPVKPSTPSKPVTSTTPTTPAQPSQPTKPPAETKPQEPTPTTPPAVEPTPEQPAPEEKPPETETPTPPAEAPPTETPPESSGTETAPADPPVESTPFPETPPTSDGETASPAETTTETPPAAPAIP